MYFQFSEISLIITKLFHRELVFLITLNPMSLYLIAEMLERGWIKLWDDSPLVTFPGFMNLALWLGRNHPQHHHSNCKLLTLSPQAKYLCPLGSLFCALSAFPGELPIGL